MSLILDALRKMEQDRKARRGGSVDIRPEVLNYRGKAQPSPKRSPLPFVVAGLILLAAGIGTGVLMKETPPSRAPQSSGEITRSVEAPKVQPPPLQPPAPAPSPPAAEAPARTEPAPSKAGTNVPPALPHPRTASEAPSAASVEPGGAQLTISGIAWQDERSLRRAVVNGTLVGEGAEVAGARVVEIGENRVRFSRGGRSFDVPYSSGFPAR